MILSYTLLVEFSFVYTAVRSCVNISWRQIQCQGSIAYLAPNIKFLLCYIFEAIHWCPLHRGHRVLKVFVHIMHNIEDRCSCWYSLLLTALTNVVTTVTVIWFINEMWLNSWSIASIILGLQIHTVYLLVCVCAAGDWKDLLFHRADLRGSEIKGLASQL